MTVYADILIFLNLFINFFILKITSAICKDNCKSSRMILGAIIGALFSLYIFLPPSNPLTETAFRLATSGVIVLVTFSFDSFKSFFRRIGVFFASSFLYAGFMLGIWAILKPQNLAINNGIVYINISPSVLILATIFCYVVISIIRYFSKKQAFLGERCTLCITHNNKTVKVTALIDTGHSLTDTITDKPIIIIEASIAIKLLEELPTLEKVTTKCMPENGFRVIPYSSVGGKGLLTAFAPQQVDLEFKDTKKSITNVILAISLEKLGEDYKAIISPTLLV